MAKASNKSNPEVTGGEVAETTPEVTTPVQGDLFQEAGTEVTTEASAEVVVTSGVVADVDTSDIVVEAPQAVVKPDAEIRYENDAAREVQFTPDPNARLIEVKADGTILTSY
jgi:hypothetical protein